MKSPRRWAITGATGLVGNNLLRLLLQEGCEVRALVRNPEGPELKGLDVQIVKGDLGDEGALRRCLEGAEVVVHAAALVWVGASRRPEMTEVNVRGTQAVCAALPSGARLLHVSSVDALGYGTLEHPSTERTPGRPEEEGIPYVDTKRAADRMVRERVANQVIVHPTFMLGPWDWKPSSGKMLLAIAGGQARVAPPGTNNFVHVRDVVESMRAAAEAPSGTSWILGNENLRYFDAWSRMAQVIGAPPPLAQLPRWLKGPASLATGLPSRLGLAEGEINGVTTRMGFGDHCFDPSAARRELGLKATPLETATQEAWAFFSDSALRSGRKPH